MRSKNKTGMDDLAYLSGFGNEHSSESLAGALPVGRFSPQKCPYGLYAEKFSTTAFTAPRACNRRNWFYRIRPSVVQGHYYRIDNGLIRSGPVNEIETPPDQLRWDPLPLPEKTTDFVDGLVTMATNGNLHMQTGMAVHMYLANQSMSERFFYNADGELLIVPQEGRLVMHTECGVLAVKPGEICLMPRGLKFRVVLPDGPARGYVAENYGAAFILPERGPVGSDGYANQRDFMAPVASHDDREGDFQLICKFAGNLFACDMSHSPLDVVAWVGNSIPYKYDLLRFNTMGTVSYDHPDPSIYTVLTSPSDTPGVANMDFVIFPERWMVAENTFRPPWYHRNIMSEFMGLVYGQYDAKPQGFSPGACSLHNCMTPHGPDTESFATALETELKPQRYENVLAFMFESRYIMQPTDYALRMPQRQQAYTACWQGIKKHFSGRDDSE